jgi:hypothetical protein
MAAAATMSDIMRNPRIPGSALFSLVVCSIPMAPLHYHGSSMRRFLFAFFVLIVPTAVRAQSGAPIESAYTNFDARACRHTAGRVVEDYGTWRCPGTPPASPLRAKPSGLSTTLIRAGSNGG